MEIKCHPRIEQIRRTSAYVSKSLTFVIWVMYFFCFLALLWMLFEPLGSVTLLDLFVNFNCEPKVYELVMEIALTLPAKLTVLLAGTILMYFLLMAALHFRGLMTFFKNGQIFSAETKACAKKALANISYAVIFFLLLKLLSYASIYYFNMWRGFLITLLQIFASIANALTLLGLLHLAFWALEIGCDLKEESELTI